MRVFHHSMYRGTKTRAQATVIHIDWNFRHQRLRVYKLINRSVEN